MREKELKVINSLKKIYLWSLLSGIIFILSGCGDFVKETDAEACNKAIDERDYDTAISTCTKNKDIASAYMGKAGYDIVNLIKATSSAPSAYTKPSGVELGEDDPSGAVILNILRLSTDVYPDDTERATKITESKSYLDKAWELLHPDVMDNDTSVSADEILLNTFALAFSISCRMSGYALEPPLAKPVPNPKIPGHQKSIIRKSRPSRNIAQHDAMKCKGI